MATATSDNGALVLSYLGLRRAIGLIGLFLPLTLALGKCLLEGEGLQNSVSSYYYTIMRDVFVGSMCAMGMFFMSYRYDRPDIIAGRLACVLALGVALFPVAPYHGASEHQKLIGMVHLACAVGFFLTLAYFAIVLFRKTHADRTPTDEKRLRNKIYAICGWTIVVCIALAVLVKLTRWDRAHEQLHAIFWLEALAIVSFGFAWLVKGETLFKDAQA